MRPDQTVTGSGRGGAAPTQQATAQVYSPVKPHETLVNVARKDLTAASHPDGSPATHEKASTSDRGPHTTAAQQQSRAKPAEGQGHSETRHWVMGDNGFALMAGGTREHQNGLGLEETRREYDGWPQGPGEEPGTSF
jgi:hypothetical protein